MDPYGEMILELAKHPVYKQRLIAPTISHTKANTSCGDTITIDLHIKNNAIINIGWDGQGCAISQAAMSIVAEECKGKTIVELEAYTIHNLTDELGIPLSARRLRCAELGLAALHEALQIHSTSQ